MVLERVFEVVYKTCNFFKNLLSKLKRLSWFAFLDLKNHERPLGTNNLETEFNGKFFFFLSNPQEQISFSVLADVCLPVSLLILIVVWGYQLNAMIVDSDSAGDDHLMFLVYGIGLIVISGTACVYIAVRMSAMQPEKITAYLQAEVNFRNFEILNF